MMFIQQHQRSRDPFIIMIQHNHHHYHHHHSHSYNVVVNRFVLLLLLLKLVIVVTTNRSIVLGSFFAPHHHHHHQQHQQQQQYTQQQQQQRHYTQQQQQRQPKVFALPSHHNDDDDDDPSNTTTNTVREGGVISRRKVLDNVVTITTTAATATATATATITVMTRQQQIIQPVYAAATESSVSSSLSSSSSSVTTTNNNKIIVPTVQLGNGSSVSVSRTIQGYWQLAGGHGKYNERDAIQNMIQHYHAGINTLDTADIYGPSEIIIGKFIQEQQQSQQLQLQQLSIPPLVQPIIPMTKFCCFRYLEDIDRTEVRQRILKSCERLQVKQLPLVQFFWSRYDIKRYIDVALYLTELKEEGLIQEIGLTNFDLIRLKEFHKANIPIVSHQVQLSAIDRRPIQSGMADWCYENHISLIGFGTVGSGILSDKWLGRKTPIKTPEETTTPSLRMYSTTASRFGDWNLIQELLYTMNDIAKAVREDGRCIYANISNIAQRYVLQTPSVASVLIGVRNTNHLQENLYTHTFILTQNEIDAINAVVNKRNGPIGDVWDIERSSM